MAGGYAAAGQNLDGDDGLRERLHAARAYWVTRDTIVWRGTIPHDCSFRLYAAADPSLRLTDGAVDGGEALALTHGEGELSPQIVERFPHLKGCAPLRLRPEDAGRAGTLLQGQLALALVDHEGRVLDITGLQIPGVLDDLYSYTGPLGVAFEDGRPVLRLWAPTARSVTLHLYPDSRSDAAQTVPMRGDRATGVWQADGAPDWNGRFYRYEVEVYVPATGRVERNLVTDPYSISLATNSRRSQIVDLADPAWMPPGWQDLRKPALDGFGDIVLYELHVRDFSITDQSVPAELRGTYQAFAQTESNGMRHLRRLADAGITHVHLLPVFDIATIDENPLARIEPDWAELSMHGSDSDRQAAIIEPIHDQDGFNWGYDPYHYTTPEGSYAVERDGAARIREFRSMVQALAASGLRVIMDVVYNHTHASGQSEKSVLDKVVPGYYHRLNAEGGVEKSTCCDNTATEHAMMEKLMLDSLRTWATAYKIDGFRFDLMGHHLVRNMVNVRQMLSSLTPARDGVDGSRLFVYGEGWDFGEVAYGQRGPNAAQMNMAGTGVATFNDRLRDAARGGSAFSGLQDQGFLTGLFTAPNDTPQNTPEYQRSRLLHLMDQVRIGLAGSLRDYELTDMSGRWVRAADVWYNDKPTGYVTEPHEVVNYLEAHDNETLWDAIQLKAARYIPVQLRAQLQMVGNSLLLLGQGIPFFQAGQELLRSKSLDRNSYDSGDWYNRIDWTYATNNWGVGLPPGENRYHWGLMRSLLGDPALRVGRPEIERSLAHFEAMLRIRKSSPLFRLPTAADITRRLKFPNVGYHQLVGLIVMHLDDRTAPFVDEQYAQIVVLFNAAPYEQTFRDGALANAGFTLHPIQAAGPFAAGTGYYGPEGAFWLPAFSTAVFVAPRDADR